MIRNVFFEWRKFVRILKIFPNIYLICTYSLLIVICVENKRDAYDMYGKEGLKGDKFLNYLLFIYSFSYTG